MTASSLIAASLIIVFRKDAEVKALTASIPADTIGVSGRSATFDISFTLSGGKSLDTVEFKKGLVRVFRAIATIPSVANGTFYLDCVSRCSTNYYNGRTSFTITLSQVSPSDEGEYSVEVGITGDAARSVTQLVVDFLPSTPSITGPPTQPVLGGAGPTVLTCTANLGKPQAAMVWSRRIGNAAYTNITENVTVSTTNNPDGTTSGTSTLKVYLDTADDGVQFRCQVSNRQATLSADTADIKVTDTASSHNIWWAPQEDFTPTLTC